MRRISSKNVLVVEFDHEDAWQIEQMLDEGGASDNPASGKLYKLLQNFRDEGEAGER